MAAINSRKRSGRRVWLAQIRLKGLSPVSRQFDSREEAKAWAEEEERRLRSLREPRARVVPEIGKLTIDDLIDRYLKDPNTKALDSLVDTERMLGWWRDSYGGVRVLDFGAPHVTDARGLLLDGRKPATVNRYLAWMRRAWNWGRKQGLVDSATAWPPETMLEERTKRVRYLSDEELAAVLEQAQALHPVVRAAILLSLATGIRQGELLRLEWRDVNFQHSSISIRETKTDTPRAVFLPEVAAAALKELKQGPVVGRAVFLDESGRPLTQESLLYRWKRIRKAAGLKDFRWHDLRHSCASFLAQNGASLLEIGQVLGHKSSQTTERYTHLVAGKAVTGHDALNRKLRGGQS